MVTVAEPPTAYIDEADGFLDTLDCFAGDPNFEADRAQNIGMFHLYAAQLRVAKYQAASSNERPALLSQIRNHLDEAAQLGSHRPADQKGVDLLERANEFDRHRVRLIELRDWLKKNSPGN